MGSVHWCNKGAPALEQNQEKAEDGCVEGSDPLKMRPIGVLSSGSSVLRPHGGSQIQLFVFFAMGGGIHAGRIGVSLQTARDERWSGTNCLKNKRNARAFIP